MATTPEQTALASATQYPRELEWQLAGADLGQVERWLSEHATVAGLAIERRPTLELSDTYFDTADWRLHRAGFVLRVRGGDGAAQATLKSLVSSRPDAMERVELNETLPEHAAAGFGAANGPVAKRVHAVAGRQPLRALFELSTQRRRYAVRAADGDADLGEIALDVTDFARPTGEHQGSAERVEVEARTPEPAPIEQLVKVLRSECGLRDAAGSKFVLGLQSVGLEPPPADLPLSTHLDPRMSAAEVARANLRRQLTAWLAHEPRARLGDDPEELHELRNAARRMHAILTLYAEHLPGRLVRARAALKQLVKVLGHARDLDVALAELAQFARGLAPAERRALEPLVRHEQQARVAARAQMLRALDTAKTRQLLATLKLGVERPQAMRGEIPQQPALAAVPALLRGRYRKLRKAVEGLDAESPPEAYHAVRSHVKKIRYAVESMSEIYGDPATEMLQALRRLQDRLGLQQDAHVARSRLAALASDAPDSLPPDTLFLMGMIAERHSVAAADARARVGKAYRRVRRRWKAVKSGFADPVADPVADAAPAF
jgi:CHAD domain-containing protein